MHDPNRLIVEAAAQLLHPMLADIVFVGGCATGLLVTDPAAGDVRPTTDVDVIAEVGSYAEYTAPSERLRAIGLTEDNREDAPTCRWRYEELVLDVLPTNEQILGFASQWYRPAIASADHVQLRGVTLQLITSVYFVATKLEAFRGRGGDDYAASHDLEDLLTIVDGRPTLTDEMLNAPTDVQRYIAIECRRLLDTRAFRDALPGYLLPDAASHACQPLLLDRLELLASLA